MAINVIGIVGSANPKGDTAVMVEEALRGAGSLPNVETQLLSFAGRRIVPCGDCPGCSMGRVGPCPVQDDSDEIIDTMLASDGILIGTPVQVGGISAVVKALLERCSRLTTVASPLDEDIRDGLNDLPLNLLLRNKVGGALAVGARSGGQEQAIREIHSFFLLNDMFVVADGGIRTAAVHTHFGGTGTVQLGGSVREDEYGMLTAWSVGRRVAEVATIVRAGLRHEIAARQIGD